MAITTEARLVQQRLDDDVNAVTDAHHVALVAAWVLAWDELSVDLVDVIGAVLDGETYVTKSRLLRSQRVRAALTQIRDRLNELAELTRTTITGDVADVVRRAADGQDELVAASLPADAPAPPAADQTALDAIVRRVTQQITSTTDPLSPTAYEATRAELVRGVAVGDNPRATARRMVRRSERQFNGGLARALNISRTETLDAHRVAAQHQQDAHTDVLQGWVWLAHLGPRTCASCLAKHGTFYDLSVPGPHDHQSGRCARMPKTKSWAELGYDDVDEPPDDVQDAEQWFKSQPRKVQRRILGPTRLAAYEAGEIALSDLTQLRRTPGWRDSWGVPSVSSLRQSARRAS